jgi:hypothetical protein
MKHNILTRSITALMLALPIAHADDPKAEEKKEPAKPNQASASTSLTASADGTATVTIDINGKKETRTFKLGDGKHLFSFSKDGDGAKAMGGVGFGGNIQPMPEHAKREKGPWIGIAMEQVQDVVRAQLSLAPGEGIVVSHVMPDSPAAKAGLQANDIILRFEDQIIVEMSQLKKLIAMKKPGESVKLTYLRKGERKDATVTLVEHEFETDEGNPVQWPLNAPGVFNLQAPGIMGRLDPLQRQEQLRQMKEKHPGVIVDKREWFSGSPEQMLKGQIEKLLRGLDESKLPKEEIEKIHKELEHARHEAEEAIERAKRGTEEAVKNAQHAVEDAAKVLNDSRNPRDGETRKPHEKAKGDQPKKPGEPL